MHILFLSYTSYLITNNQVNQIIVSIFFSLKTSNQIKHVQKRTNKTRKKKQHDKIKKT
jgi:hypothetical protein